MSSSYGQYCPVAKAMELLDERWTMLVIRELLVGSRHFAELRRGVPRMSPSLLSKRLRTLQRAGIVERREDGNRVEYRLTEAGADLAPIVEALGEWGMRWMPQLGDEDLDPHLLVWDMHRGVDADAVPEGRTVVRLTFVDVAKPARDWWLVIKPDAVDVCHDDPGFGVHLAVESDLRTLTRVWRGDRSWPDALRAGDVAVRGAEPLRRGFPEWLRLSAAGATPSLA